MRPLAVALVLAVALPTRGDAPSDDPGRGRYLFAPSAFLLRGGEVVVAQTELLMSSATVGIGSHVNVLLGTATPALSLAGANTLNLAFGLKVGFSPTSIVHLATGFETLTIPGATGGYGFGVATLGHERLNLTVGGGIPLLAMGPSSALGPPLMFFAGNVGIGRHLAVASENWWFPTRPDLPMINSGLLRVLVWRFSFGFGAAFFSPLRIPLPWIDLAMRVGG